MLVIPGVNSTTFEGAISRIHTLSILNPQWIHIDVADGIFTPQVTWSDPRALVNKKEFKNIFFEVHCMMQDSVATIHMWSVLENAKRFIVHPENFSVHNIIDSLKEDKTIGISITPATSLNIIYPYIDAGISFVQILAVPPGYSGQQFDVRSLEKIREIRTHYPHITLEVDGGITPEIAREAKDAGGDIVVSTSYLSGSPSVLSERFSLLSSI